MNASDVAERMAAVLQEVPEGQREEVLDLVLSVTGLVPVNPVELEAAWAAQRDFLVGDYLQAVVEARREEFVRRVDATRACLSDIARVHVSPSYAPVRICVPAGYLPFSVQMEFVILVNQKGKSYQTENAIGDADGVQTPIVPFLAYDIDDGAIVLGLSPNDGSKKIVRLGRLRGTVAQGIALVTHEPHRLQGRGIDLSGSLFRGYVPYLCLSGRRPGLVFDLPGGSHPRWGSASCGGVLVPGT